MSPSGAVRARIPQPTIPMSSIAAGFVIRERTFPIFWAEVGLVIRDHAESHRAKEQSDRNSTEAADINGNTTGRRNKGSDCRFVICDL